MNRLLKSYERVIIISLTVMLALAVVLSVIDLGWFLIKDILTPPVFLLEVDELLEIFAMFLLVLIGVERNTLAALRLAIRPMAHQTICHVRFDTNQRRFVELVFGGSISSVRLVEKIDDAECRDDD